MTDNKVVAGLLATGLVVGGLAVFPIARASQPVKTVTQTQVKKVAVGQIQNGESLTAVLKSMGQPARVTVQPSAKNNYIECVAWVSSTTRTTPARGDWEMTLCVKTQ